MTGQTARVEYAIYTFDLPVSQKNRSKWNKYATLSDITHAVSEARDLLKTHKFSRVEITKKFVDPKTNTPCAETVKTFHAAPRHLNHRNIYILAGLSIAALLSTIYFLS